MRLPGHKRPLRRWMAVALVVVAVGVGGLLATRLRQPVEVVVTPVADAYVSTAHPDANYGTEPTLRADATPKIRSYLRFRLPELSGRIVRAQLRLWSPTGDLAGYSVHPVTSNRWDERRHHLEKPSGTWHPRCQVGTLRTWFLEQRGRRRTAGRCPRVQLGRDDTKQPHHHLCQP